MFRFTEVEKITCSIESVKITKQKKKLVNTDYWYNQQVKYRALTLTNLSWQGKHGSLITNKKGIS